MEYILIAGVNSSQLCAQQLGELLANSRALVMLNVIPYNPTAACSSAFANRFMRPWELSMATQSLARLPAGTSSAPWPSIAAFTMRPARLPMARPAPPCCARCAGVRCRVRRRSLLAASWPFRRLRPVATRAL